MVLYFAMQAVKIFVFLLPSSYCNRWKNSICRFGDKLILAEQLFKESNPKVHIEINIISIRARCLSVEKAFWLIPEILKKKRKEKKMKMKEWVWAKEKEEMDNIDSRISFSIEIEWVYDLETLCSKRYFTEIGTSILILKIGQLTLHFEGTVHLAKEMHTEGSLWGHLSMENKKSSRRKKIVTSVLWRRVLSTLDESYVSIKLGKVVELSEI